MTNKGNTPAIRTISSDSPLNLVPKSIRIILNNEIHESRLSYECVTTDYKVENRERFSKHTRVLVKKDGEDMINDVWRAILSSLFARDVLITLHKSDYLFKKYFNWNSSHHLLSWNAATYRKIVSRGYDAHIEWTNYKGSKNHVPASLLLATALFEQHFSDFLSDHQLVLNLISVRESGMIYDPASHAGLYARMLDSRRTRLWKEKPNGELTYFDSDGKMTFQPFSYSFERGRAMGEFVVRIAKSLNTLIDAGLVAGVDWWQDDYASSLIGLARLFRTKIKKDKEGEKTVYIIPSCTSVDRFVAGRILTDLYFPSYVGSVVAPMKNAETTTLVVKGVKYSPDTCMRTLQAGMYKFLTTMSGVVACNLAYVRPAFPTGRVTKLALTSKNISDPVFYSGNTALQANGLPVKWAYLLQNYSEALARQEFPGWRLFKSGAYIFAYKPPLDRDLKYYSISDEDAEDTRRYKRRENLTTQVAKELRHIFTKFSIRELALLFLPKGSSGAILANSRSDECKYKSSTNNGLTSQVGRDGNGEQSTSPVHIKAKVNKYPAKTSSAASIDALTTKIRSNDW